MSRAISVNSPHTETESQPPWLNVKYLESEFGRDGVGFKDLGENYVIKMLMENGSGASLVLPAGLITSYKPKMWHGASVEVLHTSVTHGPAGSPVILGGVSLLLEVLCDDGFSWSPRNNWTLNSVDGSSEDSIQVEMMCRDSCNNVQVKHILTLKDDTLISEIQISSLTTSQQLEIRASVLTHFNVSTPEATYAFGLEASNYVDTQPLNSNFSIIPPHNDIIRNRTTSLFSSDKDVREDEEDENYKQLSDQMSRIYRFAPRTFTIIDRGKRNSVSVGRRGFEEVYIYSPGSSHESYGKYSYISVGQSALLKPLSLAPLQTWTGHQILHNPNL